MSWWLWVAAIVVGGNVVFVLVLVLASALTASRRADEADEERELPDLTDYKPRRNGH